MATRKVTPRGRRSPRAPKETPKEEPKATKEESLKRLIYLNNVDPKYISGGEKYIPVSDKRQKVLDEFVKKNLSDLLQMITAASEDILLPHRFTLYSILASTLISEECKPEWKPDISVKTALAICNSDQDFFDFIKYASLCRQGRSKMSNTVSKAVRKFYLNKSAVELAKSYAKYNSYHKWTHKDLIKLGHAKSNTSLKKKIFTYILFKRREFIFIEHEGDDEEAREVYNILTKSTLLRQTNDTQTAVQLISELKATIFQVEPGLQKSAEVWNAVLPNMSFSEVLWSTTKLYRLGFLKKDSPTLALINELLSNSDQVKASNIHPLEVFIHIKNFEKGGKPMDPKLLEHLSTEKNLSSDELAKRKLAYEVKCPQLIDNLYKCLDMSFGNILPTGKRYMITIDVTDKKDTLCLHNKNISGLEAAVAFMMVFLKVEEDVTVAVYKDREIATVELDKNANFYEHLQKIRGMKSKYLIPSSSIEWARSKVKQIDIFFNFIHHKEYMSSVPKELREKVIRPADSLRRYRKIVNLPNAKLVTFCMSSPHINFADGSPNILDVTGLDVGVPKAVEAFCRGHFC